jgi:hypothetical protein
VGESAKDFSAKYVLNGRCGHAQPGLALPFELIDADDDRKQFVPVSMKAYKRTALLSDSSAYLSLVSRNLEVSDDAILADLRGDDFERHFVASRNEPHHFKKAAVF